MAVELSLPVITTRTPISRIWSERFTSKPPRRSKPCTYIYRERENKHCHTISLHWHYIYKLLTYLCRIDTFHTNMWTIRNIINTFYPCKYVNHFKFTSKLSISYDISANLTNAYRICICLVSIHHLHPENISMPNISN